jgi:methylase of polypeptide subunit release factors
MGRREIIGGFNLRSVLHKGFKVNYTIHPCVYEPEEDSFLLSDSLVDAFQSGLVANSVIEFGVGSGYISSLIFSLWNPRIFFGTDINWYAIEATMLSLGRVEGAQSKGSIVLCDRDSCLADNVMFDLAISNPPYLLVDDVASDECGKLLVKSWSCSQNCLVDFCSSLCRRGKVVFMVLSSLSPLDDIFRCMKRFNCNTSVVKKKRFFFEELFVVKGEKLVEY